jgi:hypothetical protein
MRVTARIVLTALAVAATVGGVAAAQAPPPQPPPAQQQPPPQPPAPTPPVNCADPALRCPDLQMRPPFSIWAQHTAGGRTLLHAANAILSVGRGPVTLLGRRASTKDPTMSVRQRVYTRTGGHVDFDIPARLTFKAIPGQGHYWKFVHASEFQLWTMGPGRRRVRTGAKLVYCFRDLQRLRPSARSPRTRVYPGCSQDPSIHRVRLGTSVGWADVYPSTYYEQYIDVTGLRGCFALWQLADPTNAIVESNDLNNASRTVVRLPFRGHAGRC